MLHTEPPHQGIYAPLSQAMTDSESDEEIEIHNSKKHRQQQLEQNRRTKRRTPPNTLALNQRPTQQRRQQQQERLHLNYQFNAATQSSLGNGHPPSSYTTNMQNTFRSVMMSDIGLNGDFSSFTSDADNVAILGNDNKEVATKLPMSPLRRCCFIASLVLCLVVVVGFVWIVPCNSGSTCPAPVDRVKTHNWLNNYTKIELKGGVNIVGGLRSWENNMIFLYRGDVFFPEYKPTNTKRNGIISLIGSSGKVAWYDETVDEPVAIDCTLLDVDHNGRPDCLIIDDFGELGAINPLTGQWLWRYRERSAVKVDAFDFPIILPDLNDDNVLDILMISSAALEQRTKAYVRNGEVQQDQRNVLRILSGRSGKPIGLGFRIHECNRISKLQFENTQNVTFSCRGNNNTETQRSKTLAELYALITNKSILGLKLLPAAKISQHRHYAQRKDSDTQRNIFSLSGRELIVENRGKCPDCNVTLILSETRNGKLNVLRNFTNSGMYGMEPTQWHFKNTKTKMSGFVMKFWKWSTPVTSSTNSNSNSNTNTNLNSNTATVSNSKNAAVYTPSVKQTNPSSSLNSAGQGNAKTSFKDNATKNTKQQQQQQQNQSNKPNRNLQKRQVTAHEFPSDGSEFDLFEERIKRRASFDMVEDSSEGSGERDKRSISSSSPYNNNNTKSILPKASALMKNYKMQMITETVILVLFIGADTRIENTSQSNIVQFCRKDLTEEICQPDLSNQENSMVIADLDQDGSQELVSYMSTFVQTGDDVNDWRLVTYVRLLRLQSELPVFYDEKKGN